MITISFTPIKLSAESKAKYLSIQAKLFDLLREQGKTVNSNEILAIKFFVLMAISPTAMADLLREMVAPLQGNTWMDVITICQHLELGWINEAKLGNPVWQQQFGKTMEAAWKELAEMSGVTEKEIITALRVAI